MVAQIEVEAAKQRLRDQEIAVEHDQAERRAAFFQSLEFFEALADRSSQMMHYGFEGALWQCVETGLLPPPEADVSHLDPLRVFEELPASVRADNP